MSGKEDRRVPCLPHNLQLLTLQVTRKDLIVAVPA